MNSLIPRLADNLTGILSGFDRLVFRGYLRQFVFPQGLFSYLCWRKIPLTGFRRFALEVTDRLKDSSLREARRSGRPVVYLPSSKTDKEARAREILASNPVTDGLICVLACVEPCRSYDVGHNPETRRYELRSRNRKCLFLYHYSVDPVFGFMNARIQTWFPFSIQVCLNGREWLSRQMDRAGLSYERRDNCFAALDDPARAQKLMDEQLQIRWPRELGRIERRLNPDRAEILPSDPEARYCGGSGPHVLAPPKIRRADPASYYWTVYQSEWATDLMFRDARTLAQIYPRLTRHAISAFGSADVMRFLGGKVHGNFRGQIVSDFKDRPEGVRVKHRVGLNSIKLYDKQGSVLRVETTINDPKGFKVFRPREGDGRGPRAWRPLRKGVADLHRRAQLSQRANERYLQALGDADTSTPVGELLAGLDRPVRWHGQRVRGLRAWSSEDLALFGAVNRGEFALNGFRNGDLQALLYATPPEDDRDRRRRSARVTRLIRLLRAHRLARKVPRTRRYRLTPRGRTVLTAVLALQDTSLEKLHKAA